jgi:hypothetical protein
MCVPRDPVRTIRTGLFRPVSLARRQPEQAADLFPAEGATRGVVGVSFGKRLQYVRLGEPTLRLFIHRRRIILIGFAGHANELNPGFRNRFRDWSSSRWRGYFSDVGLARSLVQSQYRASSSTQVRGSIPDPYRTSWARYGPADCGASNPHER